MYWDKVACCSSSVLFDRSCRCLLPLARISLPLRQPIEQTAEVKRRRRARDKVIIITKVVEIMRCTTSCVYVFTQLAGDSPDWAQILRKVFFGIFGAFWSSRLHGKCIVKLVSSQTTIVEPTMIWSNDRVICNDDDDAAVCGVCVCVFVKVCQFPKCEKICCANIFIANARLIIANNFLFSIILWCCCCF